MRALVREAGLQDRIELDSAGTGGWHVGESPDARATEAAGRRGIVLEGAARKVRPRDFEEFDLILAMDASNLRDLQRIAPDEQAREKVRLLREWERAGSDRRRPRRARPLLRRAGRLRPGARPRAGSVHGAAGAVARGRRRADSASLAGGGDDGRPPHESRALPPQARMSLPPGATNARRVGGGDINEAWRVTLADGREAFVKTRPDAGAEEYATEARGLQWLAEPGALRTPRVLEVAEDYLVLEWVQQGSLSAEGAEELGRGLALTHAAGAPAFGAPLLGTPALLPRRAPPNGRRGRRGGLDLRLAATAQRPHPRLADLLRPAAPAPAGGDRPRARRPLGAGRARGRGGMRAPARACRPTGAAGAAARGSVERQRDGRRRRPPVADRSLRVRRPSRGGSRDAAAVRRLPPTRIFAAYEEAAPLAEGWEERVELWQLLPLLVHAVLFGGSYVAAAEQVARRYAS